MLTNDVRIEEENVFVLPIARWFPARRYGMSIGTAVGRINLIIRVGFHRSLSSCPRPVHLDCMVIFLGRMVNFRTLQDANSHNAPL